jgi:hypothetical protein
MSDGIGLDGIPVTTNFGVYPQVKDLLQESLHRFLIQERTRRLIRHWRSTSGQGIVIQRKPGSSGRACQSAGSGTKPGGSCAILEQIVSPA